MLHALVFASLAGAAVAAALALGSAPVLGVMGCSDALMTSAREYCLGRAWSVPAVMVLTVGQVRAMWPVQSLDSRAPHPSGLVEQSRADLQIFSM